MKSGKTQNTALLRTMLTKEHQNFATIRLIRDLRELENESIPTVGVTALPSDENLFDWSANIRGPAGTPYEGGVFHIHMTIPPNYPHSPPTLSLKTPITHPNVFGSKVCLDILEGAKGPGQGWTTAYTLQSILIQLQSFLFEGKNYSEEELKKIKKQLDQANSFECKCCKHKGRISSWPSFPKTQEESEFIIAKTEEEVFAESLKCFHTRLSPQDSPLGVGLNITRVPRTGLIKGATPMLDLLSLKGFVKEGVRMSTINEKFSYWLPLPLYFAKENGKFIKDKYKEKVVYLAEKAISMMCAGNTKHFKEEMVLEVMTKIILQIVFLMMEEKRHPSINLIQIMVHVHALLEVFATKYPSISKQADEMLEKFIKDPSYRNKDNIPNSGLLLSLLLISNKFTYGDLIKAYTEEQLDRLVFWILKKIPELEETTSEIDEGRANVSFSCQATSFQISAFYKGYLTFIRSQFKKRIDFLNYYEEHSGKLSDKMENQIQKIAFETLKINNFNDYFDTVGYGKVSMAEINNMLKKAIQNSLEKRYHGEDDVVFAIPSPEEQYKEYVGDQSDSIQFIEGSKLKEASEAEWKTRCITRWVFIQNVIRSGTRGDVTPADLAQIGDSLFLDQLNYERDFPKDPIADLRAKPFSINLQEITPSAYLDGLTWQQLYLKLDMEDTLRFFNINPNFKALYKKIEVIGPLLQSLVLPIMPVKNIKSGYYYMTVLISGLTNLKYLRLQGYMTSAPVITMACIKDLYKGFMNLAKKGNNITTLTIGNLKLTKSDPEITEKMKLILLSMEKLTQLFSIDSNVFMNSPGALSRYLSTHYGLKDLMFVRSELNLQVCKEIADGIMRAKQLERIILTGNTALDKGLAQIIYNLAFAPRLRHLDISQNSGINNLADIVESISKLMKISPSLEVLDISNIATLNQKLNLDFFKALGEVGTLQRLKMSGSGVLSTPNLLGRAIAFNSIHKGSLEYLDLSDNAIQYTANLNSLISSMQVSEKDHEDWYGDARKSQKMEGKDLEKNFHCNLKHLLLSKNTKLKSDFNVISHKKYPETQKPVLPLELILSKGKLRTLSMASCSLDKTDCDLLEYIYEKNSVNIKLEALNLSSNNLCKEGIKSLCPVIEKASTLKALDLSKTKMGVSGAKSLAEALLKNNSIEHLNIYANIIDVDGTRAIGKLLEQNKTLQFLDMGFNRARNAGLSAVSEGLQKNKESKLKYLGLRYNFINEDGFNKFLNKVFAKGNNSKITHIYIKKNKISEYECQSVMNTLSQLGVTLNIDTLDRFHVALGVSSPFY